MKRTAIVFALILTATMCAASPLPDFPFVYVHGRAGKELPTDNAFMTFTVKAFHKDASNAVGHVHLRSAQIIGFLGRHGFTDEDIVSYEIDKSAVREKKNYQELNILGYDATRKFQLSMADLKRYGAVVEYLLELEGVTEINSVFGRKDRETVEAALLAEACKDAARKAESLAKGFGKKLGAVHCISQHGFESIGGEFGLGGGFSEWSKWQNRQADAKDSPLFIPKTVYFANGVSAIYRLEEK